MAVIQENLKEDNLLNTEQNEVFMDTSNQLNNLQDEVNRDPLTVKNEARFTSYYLRLSKVGGGPIEYFKNKKHYISLDRKEGSNFKEITLYESLTKNTDTSHPTELFSQFLGGIGFFRYAINVIREGISGKTELKYSLKHYNNGKYSLVINNKEYQLNPSEVQECLDKIKKIIDNAKNGTHDVRINF